MSSDSEFAKKALEREALEPFMEAYAVATGISLAIIESGENPDFVCERSDGAIVGVELTEVRRAPIDRHLDRVLWGQEELASFDAVEIIHQLLSRKEEARTKRYILRAPRNVLVLQLTDIKLTSVRPALEGLQNDFRGHGFEEIWLADYSELDAYGTVELYGLFPASVWGFHQRPNFDSKPYG